MPSNQHKAENSSEESSIFGREARKHQVLTKEEEFLLARKTKGSGGEAKRAKEEFFLRNMKLVLVHARKFAKYGAPDPDIIQEGSIGLMRAIEKFDPDKGFRFSTYASWWIRQTILRYIYKSDEIRLPIYVAAHRNLISRVQNQHPEWSTAEIHKWTGFSDTLFSKIINLPKVELSLEDTPFEESDATVGDTISDDSFREAEDKISLEEIVGLVTRVLEDYPERDRQIYWSSISDEQNLSTIGEAWGISRERVRQIVLKVNSKVRLEAGFGNALDPNAPEKKTPKKKSPKKTRGKINP